MTVLAIANQKGGVGKTTTAHNLGHCLVLEGRNVLLIDLDQRGDLTTCVGLNPDAVDKTIYDVIVATIHRRQEPTIDQVSIETDFGAFIASANDKLSGAQADLMTAVGGDSILKYAIQKIKNQYDYIIIDTPADLNLLTINALVASDQVIIPIQTEFLSAKGARRLLETITVVRDRINPNLEIAGLILTMISHTLISQEIADATYKTFNQRIPVYKTVIRRRVALASAQRNHQTIFQFDPKSDSAADYRDLTKEVIDHA